MPAPELQRWALLIPDYFPASMNQTHHAHWSSVRKHKKAALEHLHIYCLQSGGVPEFVGHARVTITRLWGKGQRAWDTENVYGAVKPLVDAMRVEKAGANQSGRTRQGGLGIIEDDDRKACTLTCHQEKNGSPEGVAMLQANGIDPAGVNFDQACTLIVVEGKRLR